MSTDRSKITETECRAIATALGEGWTVEPIGSDAWRAAYLNGPDSQRLLVAVDWRKNERLEIRGEIPTPYDRRRYDYVPAVITVSRDKAPEKIAREAEVVDITTYRMPWAAIGAKSRISSRGTSRITDAPSA